MRNWDQLIDNHMRICEARGISPACRAGRRRELDRWGIWLKRRKPKPQVEAIDSEHILEYIKGRTAFHSKASVSGVMSHMRCLGDFLVTEGVWLQNPLRWIRSPKSDPRRHSPRRIDKDHLVKLLAQAASIPNEFRRQQMFATLVVLYGTGIRRGELVRLKMSDWNPIDRTLRIDSNKVNRERVLPLPESVAACLESYLPHRQNRLIQLGIQEEQTIFIKRDGKPYSGERVSVAVHRLAKAAGIPLVTIHQFRHTCASDLLAEGVGLAEVQKVLGHACIVTTVRYAHVADPDRRKAASIHPINHILKSLYEQGERHE